MASTPATSAAAAAVLAVVAAFAEGGRVEGTHFSKAEQGALSTWWAGRKAGGPAGNAERLLFKGFAFCGRIFTVGAEW